MNLLDLYAKITLDDSEYKQKIGEADESASSFASKLGSGLKKAAAVGAKAVAAVSTAAAGGMVALTKSAIENYAEYEQLIGGVETLFKNSADVVQQYANNAFKTAGLSANEYMETVTSFSASLLQSLGGDTAAAAEYADLAITDMADNANKMGTDISMIQNAYQGFAKQNYTMLDNLKLGYGGTQAEMKRLLADAEAISGIEYDISSYADIVAAIHVVQEEMGIAGTTAKEASSTISGSLSSMKSAWQNLLTGIADDSADFDSLVGNLVDSAKTFGENILPRISVAMDGIVQLVGGLAPQLVAAIPALVEQVLPGLLDGVFYIVEAVGAVLPGLVSTIASVLVDQSHYIIQSVLDLLLILGQSLVENIPVLVDSAVAIIDALAMWLVEYSYIFLQTAVDLVVALATGLTDNLPELIPVIVSAVMLMAQTLTNPDNIGNIIDAAIEVVFALVDGLLEALPVFIDQAPVIIENLVVAIVKNAPKLLTAAAEIIGKLVTGIVDKLPQIGASAGKIIGTLVKGAKDLWYKVKSIGTDIVSGVWNGINEKLSWFTEKVKGFFSGIVSGVKKTLGINSPSKVFSEIGGFMAAGLGEGWDDEYAGIKKQIEGGLDFGTAKVGFEASAMGAGTAGLAEKLSQAFNVIGEGVTIVVQSILDGKVIGETSYQYAKNKQKAYGG